MDIRSTAFWLFWLTFVSLHRNQFNMDRCVGAAVQSRQSETQQQHQKDFAQSAATGLAERANDSGDRLSSTPQSFKEERRAAGRQPKGDIEEPHLFEVDFDRMKSRAPREFPRSASINSSNHSKVDAGNALPPLKRVRSRASEKSFKNTRKFAESVDNFTDLLRDTIAQQLLVSPPPPQLTTPRDYVGPIPASEVPAGESATGGVADSRPHPPERRHIGATEKLQYTSQINIKQGRLMGIIRQFHSSTGLRSVDQYLGLPYAEAPVGSRRFMPPGTPLPWMGLKIARHLPPVCPQKLPDLNDMAATEQHAQPNRPLRMSRGRYKYLTRLLPYLKNESEDCLYLNLYVPRDDGLGQPSLYPVLVYIHGESFEWNSGNPYDGSVLASYGQTIVVTVNYRLGVMGFLKPSIDENTVANFGLLDQIAALHWIKENIEAFGGNRDSVTLMGHSTGAACINYLMISPVASGLFHRAILMSGSAMSDWAASNHSLQLTMQIAHGLNCPLNDDDEQMLSCLRQKRYQDILKIPTSFPQFSTSLGPIVDGHVIPNQPYVVMGQYTEYFSRYDLLFGITESESYHALGALALEEGLRENERDNLLRFYMQSRFDVRPDLALAATLKKYNDMYNNPIKATNFEHRDVVLDILSDARVVGPLMQTGLFHAEANRHNYMYVFGHNSAAGPHASLPHSIAGEELAFVFGAPLAPAGPFQHNYSAQEKLLAEAVMAYWTNFAKTGNPKAPWQGNFINLHALEWDRYDLDWPEFNKRSQAYINIGIPPSIGYKYRQIYMNFWNKELPDELNQIAAMQRQPFVPAHHYPTGHWSEYGSRDNGAEDPVRTLKQLLQEPYAGMGKPTGESDDMYNAPPTFGVARHSDDDDNGYGPHTPPTIAMATGSEPVIYGVRHNEAPRNTPFREGGDNEAVAENAGHEGGDGVDAGQSDIAKSEATIQLLIGLIVVFIVLNVVIYSTFLLQKKKKSSTLAMQRKLGGILSYDGATDDELKRSKQTTIVGDGEESYVFDGVRKSNTYEAVKTERSPINGFKITRQLSCSTVDTHTKVCAWMSGVGDRSQAMEGTLQRLQKQQDMHKPKDKRSSSPTFSSLRGSSGPGGSFKQQSQRVNVSVDATSEARGPSVLGQEPIELTKGRQLIICQDVEVSDQELLTPQDSLDASKYSLVRQDSSATEACEASLQPLHQHSRSDPVDMYCYQQKGLHGDEKVTSFMDINVTSRSDDEADSSDEPLTPEQQLLRMQQRKYPKVLPASAAREQDSLPMTSDLSTTYKRNSLPPNSFMPGLLGKLVAPPMPPPRTISTLGRKPSPSGRRNSTNVTTSPLMLAADCTEEEDEPQITQNTLIVGPIVPKQTEGLYSTLKRRENATDKAAVSPPQSPASIGLKGSFQSFESCPPGASAAEQAATNQAAHHTEKVYAIDAPPSLDTAAPVVYAQPSKVTNRGAVNKTGIPRIAGTHTAPPQPVATSAPSRIPQPTPRQDAQAAVAAVTAKDRSSSLSGSSSSSCSTASGSASGSVTTSASSSYSSSSSSSTGTVRTELQPQRPTKM